MNQKSSGVQFLKSVPKALTSDSADENEDTFDPMLPEKIFGSLGNGLVTTFRLPTHCFLNENSRLKSNSLGRVTGQIINLWIIFLSEGGFG